MSKRYAELLRDPRWQRKRLEVMAAADFTCVECGDKSTTLNVHHVHYVRGRKPWEYDLSDLQCLCERCHTAKHNGPASRTVTFREGPLDGGTRTTTDAFPLYWVYEKDGATFVVEDAWRVVLVGNSIRASHFARYGHPMTGHRGFRRGGPEEKWRGPNYPVLLGLYGLSAPGEEYQVQPDLLWHDPDALLLRLTDLESVFDEYELNEARIWTTPAEDAE